jgi:hypothetical protein
MARSCTCQICKKKGTSDVFYKVTNDKGQNKYYCSKEEYDGHVYEIKRQKELKEYIAVEILNYEEGQIVPPVMIKKLNELNKFYDCEVIHECFKEKKEDIQYWITTKNFANEYGMVSYVMKIIEGSINDTYTKWKHKKNQEQKKDSNEIDLGIMNETKVNVITKKDTGILEFLDEEDI